MKTYLECIPCFVQQAYRAGKIAIDNENIRKQILDEVGKMISRIPMENTPPETGMAVYQKISEITGIPDPYKKIKKQNMDIVLAEYPRLQKLVNGASDPLRIAMRLAIAGNVIDLGVNRDFDILQAIDDILVQDFAIDDYQLFKTQLANAEQVLYLGDNSGEAVFDKLLIEAIDKPVIFAVKENPIINDATEIEAKYLGIDQVAKVISSGSNAPGTILHLCNPAFVELFNRSTLIISKGQGNFEGLSEVDAPIFFLLRAKCPVIAQDLNVPIDSIIIKSRR